MSFSSLLSVKDRGRLREIVKRTHLKHYPVEHLTDYEADKFIDSLSERVIEAKLRGGVDGGMVR